jgi:N-acetyl-gamma-glutamyl-phosphate reductase
VTRIFIDGAAGTTGLEIGARLANRADLSFLTLDEARRKDAGARREALNAADIVILCLPDEAAREAVALIENPATRVIDASSAHRVADGWTYGLPELGHDVAGARLVANPGCWPSGFLALVRPLVAAGLVPADWPLSYSGASGYSGGGKAMIAEFEGGEAQTGFRAYGLALTHKHLPEMQAHAGLAMPPVFLPAVANVYRGMIGEVGLVLRALPARPSLPDVRACIAAVYPAGGVIRMAEETPATIRIEADAGTDRMTLYVLGHEDQARLIATYDNLGKGAAGAAVQNLNLMIGADPKTGLVL